MTDRALAVLFSFMLLILAIGGCTPSPKEAHVTLITTGETLAYTAPCGCCGGQSGGLPRRATYLRQLAEEKSKNVGTQRNVASAVTGVSPVDSANGKPGEAVAAENGTEAVPEGARTAGEPKPAAAEEFLLVDTGNFTEATTEDKLIQSRYVSEAMELMYYDAVNLGKRELALSQERLLELLRPLKNTPVVCANVSFSRPREGKDYHGMLSRRIKRSVRTERNGQKFIITGVVTERILPHDLWETQGVETEQPDEALTKVLKHARKDEYVIVLTNSLSEAELKHVSEVKGVNLILGASGLGLSLGSAPIGETVREYTQKTGSTKGRAVDRLELLLLGEGKFKVVGAASEQLKSKYKDHPLMVELLRKQTEEVTEYQKRIHAEMASLDHATFVDYFGQRTCGDCHVKEFHDYAITRHARALRSLTEKEEQLNGLCLPCHTTGYGEPSGYNLITRPPNLAAVSCEVCHGPGEVHVQRMRGEKVTAPEKGLNNYGLANVTAATCTKCHIDTTDPGFDFEKKRQLVDHSARAGLD